MNKCVSRIYRYQILNTYIILLLIWMIMVNNCFNQIFTNIHINCRLSCFTELPLLCIVCISAWHVDFKRQHSEIQQTIWRDRYLGYWTKTFASWTQNHKHLWYPLVLFGIQWNLWKCPSLIYKLDLIEIYISYTTLYSQW